MQQVSIDNEMEKLSEDIEEFENEYREKFCKKCQDHEREHKKVRVYSTGKIYCENMRKARSRKFKKRSDEIVSLIAEHGSIQITSLQV